MKKIHEEIITSLNSQIEDYKKALASCTSDYERRYLKGAINALKVAIAKIDCVFVGNKDNLYSFYKPKKRAVQLNLWGVEL